MIAVNVGPLDGTSFWDSLYRLPHGRASLLFIVLGGIGFTLITRRARSGHLRIPWGTFLYRSGLLLLLGLLLQELDHGVRVILTSYAALFLLGLPLVRAGSRVLIALAGTSVALGPLAWIVIHDDHPTGFKREPITADQPALEIVADILVTGPYPVAVWAAPFLLGMWLGRLNLRDTRVSLRLIVWGGLTAVSARAASALLIRALGEPSSHNDWQRLVSDVAHSEMPLWVIGGTGSAVFVLGLCLRVPTWNRPWLSPLTSLGRLALTAYAAHLVVLALLVRPGPEGLAAGAAATALLCGALMLFAVIWLRVMQRGPLEALLRLPRQAKAP